MDLLSPRFSRYADERLASRASLLDPLRQGIEGLCLKAESDDERALFRYHVATLPLTDVYDTGLDLIASYARQAIDLRRESPWCRDAPEDVFVHFVACPRVNNEAITDCWPALRDALGARLAGRSTREAALEANYWCCEMASYRSTDDRTLGPLGVLACGHGRCGEESTLLVAALRANGIPARQVYAPWWSHCDDNHAWVEVFTDDGWRYLGACEPEEELDRGWFTAAAGRAMMVRTGIFSTYGCEDARDRNLLTREGRRVYVNLTPTYAPTATLVIEARHEDGMPAGNVAIRLQVLNGSAWRDIARLSTDDAGRASIEVGKGSLRVVASEGRLAANLLIDTASTTHAVLTLQVMPTPLAAAWTDLDIHAPTDHPTHSQTLTEEERRHGRERKREADRVREVRLERLADEARELAPSCLLPSSDCLPYLERALGNAGEVARFLERDDGPDRLDLLSTLDDKDLHDLDADVLEDHLEGARLMRDEALSALEREGAGADAPDLFRRYVLCPRVATERLTPYRSFIRERLDDDRAERLRHDPALLWEHLQASIGYDAEEHAEGFISSPRGALVSRQAGPESLRVLFVCICRTFGIPARVNPVDHLVECYTGGAFVSPERSDDMFECRFSSATLTEARYHLAWGVSRLDEGAGMAPGKGDGTAGAPAFKELDLPETCMEDGRCTLGLPRGTYRLTTSVRLPDGDIQAAERIFAVPCESGSEPLELRFRSPAPSDLLMDIELDRFELTDVSWRCLRCGLDAPSVGGRPAPVILSFVRPGEEPTEHLLDELRRHADELEGTGTVVVLVPPDVDTVGGSALISTVSAIGRAAIAHDDSHELAERLARRMFVNPDELPLTMLVEEDAAGGLHDRYAVAGYRVGAVDLVIRLIELCHEGCEDVNPARS